MDPENDFCLMDWTLLPLTLLASLLLVIYLRMRGDETKLESDYDLEILTMVASVDKEEDDLEVDSFLSSFSDCDEDAAAVDDQDNDFPAVDDDDHEDPNEEEPSSLEIHLGTEGDESNCLAEPEQDEDLEVGILVPKMKKGKKVKDSFIFNLNKDVVPCVSDSLIEELQTKYGVRIPKSRDMIFIQGSEDHSSSVCGKISDEIRRQWQEKSRVYKKIGTDVPLKGILKKQSQDCNEQTKEKKHLNFEMPFPFYKTERTEDEMDKHIQPEWLGPCYSWVNEAEEEVPAVKESQEDLATENHNEADDSSWDEREIWIAFENMPSVINWAEATY